jgi:CheY-like chemotaxis protein
LLRQELYSVKKTSYVLIIDDEPAVHTLLDLLLRPLSLGVAHAMSGEEGLSLLAEYQPDLLILDLQMPGLDGMGVLDHLQQNPMTAQIPVIIHSGWNSSRLSQDIGWPPQVIRVVDKAGVCSAEFRKLIQEALERESTYEAALPQAP